MSAKSRKRSTSRTRGPKRSSFRHQEHVNNLIAGQSRFAWQLYKAISANPNLCSSLNVCFSPILVHQALTMAYIGARYESSDALKSLLQLEKMENDAAINLAFGDLTKSIAISSTNDDDGLDSPEEVYQPLYTLYSAVRLYLPITHCLLDQYGAALNTFYSSDIAKVPFHTDKERARQEINQWVEESTQQKIKTLVPPLGLATFVSMVLASALYFKPNWNKQLQASGKMILSTFNDHEVLAFRLKGQFRHGTIDDADCRIVEIPFADDRHSLILILPNQTGPEVLDTVETKLTEQHINQLDTYFLANKGKLKITFPQFDISEAIPLGKVLQNDPHISKMFARGKANFSGISGNNNLHLSHVEHKVRFELEELKRKQLQLKKKKPSPTIKPPENGQQNDTKVKVKTVKMDKSRMDFNSPFLFLVRDINLSNAIILFGGVKKLSPYNPDLLNGGGNEEKKACTC